MNFTKLEQDEHGAAHPKSPFRPIFTLTIFILDQLIFIVFLSLIKRANSEHVPFKSIGNPQRRL